MAKHRTHSIEFKRHVSQEYLVGETLHALSKRHDISRNLILIRIERSGRRAPMKTKKRGVRCYRRRNAKSVDV